MTRTKHIFLAVVFLMLNLTIALPVFAESETSTVGIAFMGDDKIDVSVTLQKQDKDTKKVLSGASFELQDAKGNLVKVDDNLTTDEKGEIHLSRLYPGKYSFVETKSPTGYQLDKTPVSFEVSEDKTEVTVIAYNKKITTTEKPKQPKKQGILPSTGMKSTTGMVLLGLFILIGAIGLLSRHDKTLKR